MLFCVIPYTDPYSHNTEAIPMVYNDEDRMAEFMKTPQRKLTPAPSDSSEYLSSAPPFFATPMMQVLYNFCFFLIYIFFYLSLKQEDIESRTPAMA